MNKIYLKRITVADARIFFELRKEEFPHYSFPEFSDKKLTELFLKNLSDDLETDEQKIYLIFYDIANIGYLFVTEHKEKKTFSFYNIFVREKFRFLGEELTNCFFDFSENRGYQAHIDIPNWLDIKMRKIK